MTKKIFVKGKRSLMDDISKTLWISLIFPEKLFDVAKQYAGQSIMKLQHHIPNDKDEIRMFVLAHKYLKLYAQAKLVLTNRIHVALPCVAFGTLNTCQIRPASVQHDKPGHFSHLLETLHPCLETLNIKCIWCILHHITNKPAGWGTLAILLSEHWPLVKETLSEKDKHLIVFVCS